MRACKNKRFKKGDRQSADVSQFQQEDLTEQSRTNAKKKSLPGESKPEVCAKFVQQLADRRELSQSHLAASGCVTGTRAGCRRQGTLGVLNASQRPSSPSAQRDRIILGVVGRRSQAFLQTGQSTVTGIV